jgi:epoxide hydrolase 4
MDDSKSVVGGRWSVVDAAHHVSRFTFHASDFTHHYTRVNGIRMHYVQAGSGPTLVVLLHGFPECWWSWRHQLALALPGHPAGGTDGPIAPFAERFTLVAPDLRGYNETDKPDWGYELDVLVSDVVELIGQLGHDRAVVVGHDWGGAIAWALAITYPQRVERLIVMNAPHLAKFSEALAGNWRQMLRSWYMLFFQLPFLPEAALRANNYEAIERAFRDMAIDKSRFTDEDISIFKSAMAQPGALTAALNYYRAMRQGSRGMFRSTGMRVAAPTLLVWGEADTALGKELTYGTERFVPDLLIRYIPNCSHWIQQEQPELVNQYILEFLADLT